MSKKSQVPIKQRLEQIRQKNLQAVTDMLPLGVAEIYAHMEREAKLGSTSTSFHFVRHSGFFDAATVAVKQGSLTLPALQQMLAPHFDGIEMYLFTHSHFYITLALDWGPRRSGFAIINWLFGYT